MDKIKKLKSAIRSLPHSDKAERSVLSTMMQDPEGLWINKAIELGAEENSFHIPAHKTIFKFLEKTTQKGESIEIVSLTQKIKDDDELVNTGGESYIAEVYRYSPTSAHFNHLLKIVLDKSQLREVISKSTEAIEQAYETDDVEAFLDETEKEIFSIRKSDSFKSESSDKLLGEVISDLEDFISGGKELEGLPTRFQFFNDLTGGLKGGEMYIIAARPSMGKTALMCNIITDLKIANIPGAIFSCEMTSKQLMQRILYGRAKFPMHYLKKGFLPSKDELRRIGEAAREIKGKGLYIDDTPAIKIDSLRAKLRRLKKELYGFRLVENP